MLCDIIVLYVLQKKSFYWKKKYLIVNEPNGDGEVRMEGSYTKHLNQGSESDW